MSRPRVRIIVRVASTGQVYSIVTRWHPWPGWLTDPEGRAMRTAYRRRQLARRRRNRR